MYVYGVCIFKLDNNLTSFSQDIGEVPIHFTYFFSIYYFFRGKVARTGRYLPRGLTECHQCGGRVKVGVNSGHVMLACAVA